MQRTVRRRGVVYGEAIISVFIGVAALASCLVFPLGDAAAAKGVVVAYPPGCDYYVVESNTGYALLEWYGGSDPNEGDTLVGDFESYGFKTLYNLTADNETRVWVEDYFLSQGSVVEQIREQCF